MSDFVQAASRPKRLLVVAYYFEPQTSVGVFRTIRLLRHMLAKGWEVDVVTIANPDAQFEPVRAALPTDLVNEAGITVHYVKSWPVKPLWQWPTAILGRLGKLFGNRQPASQIASRFWHIDMQWGFAKAARGVLAKLMREHEYDLVYVSCPPFSSAELATNEADAAGVPCLLDFRDSWVPSAYASAATKRYDRLERDFLSRAAGLIVNTQADIDLYENRIDAQKLSWLPNGFDVPMQGPFARNENSERIHFVYLGAWDDGPRDPRPLLRALKAKQWHWHLSTYANDHSALLRAAQDVGVEAQISCHGFVPKADIGKVIEAADCLVLVQGYGADKAAPVTHVAAKTFDYLATGRMILGLAASGANKELLQRHQDHCALALPDDGEAIGAALEQVHGKWRDGHLPNAPDPEFLADYSETALGEKFAALCDRLIQVHSAK